MRTRNDQQRQRPRVIARQDRVAWSLGLGNPLRKAKVQDHSQSGVGLLVDGKNRPGMGTAIRVMSRGEPSLRRARVVRVVDRATGEALLGCRWISSTDHQREASRQRTIRAIQSQNQDTKGTPNATDRKN